MLRLATGDFILELIEYLAGCSEPVKLKEIVATLGFPRSSAHALAQTLVSRGYAIQDDTERYVLVHASRHRSATRANDAAIAMLKALPPNAAIPAYSLAEIYAAAGRYGEAADAGCCSHLVMPPIG